MKTPFRFDCATALTTAVALFFAPLATYAGGVAGAPQVAAGAVTFGQNGNVRTITQTSGAAIINWQDFSINAGNLTRFLQPGTNSAVLNRVLGFSPSLLNGQLQANGSVYLINPNGVIVGPQGRVDVGAFYASTLNVADDEFLKAGGALRFAGDSRAGVQNLGTINATEGDVMLIAYTVRNAGTINAAKGVAGLAAGSEVLLTHQGDQRIAVKSGLSAGGLETGVENSGLVQAAQAELKAAGGSIYSLAVNQTGVVRATGAVNKNGRVLLTADGGDVNVSGEISAHNANGDGGEILAGGGYQGKNSTVANATHTTVSASAKLDASATGATGSGGQIVVWADQTTQFAGRIAARGGSAGGDGGSLEVSGKHSLDFTGTADTSAPAGKKGRLLLDPDAVIISTDADQDLAGQGGFLQGLAVPSFLNNGTLNALLATTDVIVQAGDTHNPPGFNGISVNADVGWSAATTLTLTSRDTIAINANINAGATGNLTLQPGTASVTDGTTGAITLASNKGIAVDTLSLDRSFIGSTNGNSIGAINLAGTVTATTVELVRNFGGGVTGDVLINNPANQIGTLRGTGSVGGIAGDLRVTNSAAGLILDGDLSGVSGAVEIVTTGNLTVNSGALVKNTGASDLVLAANSGSFINNADASAIDASGAGRYLIYSDSPANTTKGGLTGLSVYNKTYGVNAPASITQTGDRFVFSLAPTLTFTADDISKSAGAANPSLTYTVSGLQTGDTRADAITGTPTLSTTAATGSPGGSYPISVANGSLALTDMGYGLSLQAGALSVIANLLTISADSASKTYGAANPAFTASYAGFTGGDTSAIVTGLQFSTSATTSSGVGTYAITPFGATAGSYAINFVPGTLTINPASLTIAANSLSKTYGAANPAFTASYSGFVNGETSSVVSSLSLGTAATSGSNAGTYAITGSGASATNYAISYAPGTLTVNKAPLTISADNASKTYGAANPAFTATYSGLVNGESSSVVSGLALGTAATTSSSVGGYPITPSGATATNYTITTQPGTLTVDPATLTVTASNASRTYGDANPGFSGNITGFVLGENSSVLTTSPTYSSSASANSNVGNYAINPSAAAAPNYTFNYAPGTLTINPAILSVRADNLTRSYGDANPTLTYSVSGLKNGDTADGKFFIFTNGTTAAPNSPVGNYNILLTGNDTPNDNYTTFFAGGTLSVLARPLTIRTDGISREYGLANPAFTATFTGLASFDSPGAIPNLGFTTLATSSSGVGDYTVIPTAGTNANYAITLLPNLLRITPAPLTVAAGNFFRDYGDANPAFTASLAAGSLRAGDTAASVGLRIATGATQSSSVGTYDLTAAISSPNYAITNLLAGSLQILPAILDVTLGNVNRFYGEANPVNPFVTATGLKLSDTASAVVNVVNPTTVQQAVGTYSQVASSGSGNYQIRSVTGGSVQVNPRPVTVTAASQTRVYGDANPAFTATVGGMGLASFDPASVLVGVVDTTVPTTRESSAGSYVIRPTLVANPNYFVTAVQPGVLTVNKRPLEISLPNLARFYYDPNPTVTATLGGAGLAPFHTAADVFSLTGLLPAQTADVGSYAYFPNFQPVAQNYALTINSGSLTIVPRAVEILVNSLTVADGATIPAFSAQFTGLPTGVDSHTAFPNLTFAATNIITIPEVRPVPSLPAYTPPASVTADSSKVDADGNVQVTTSITPIVIAPPAGQVGLTTLPLPVNLTLNDKTKSSQSISVSGYNSNPNYAVTKVTLGTLTLTTTAPRTDPAAAASTATSTGPLTVGGVDTLPVVTTPFRGPEFQPYLQQAAQALLDQLKNQGKFGVIAAYFKDGVEGFLAGFENDPGKQGLLMDSLSDVMMSYAQMPESMWPPALAGMLRNLMTTTQIVKKQDAQMVSALYDNWEATRSNPEHAMDGYFGATDVPDFAKAVAQGRKMEALISLSGGAGAAVAEFMPALKIPQKTIRPSQYRFREGKARADAKEKARADLQKAKADAKKARADAEKAKADADFAEGTTDTATKTGTTGTESIALEGEAGAGASDILETPAELTARLLLESLEAGGEVLAEGIGDVVIAVAGAAAAALVVPAAIARVVQMSEQPRIVASIADAKAIAVSPDLPSVDFSSKNDREAFARAFSTMLLGGVGF